MRYFEKVIAEGMFESDEVSNFIGDLFLANKHKIGPHQEKLKFLCRFIEDSQAWPRINEVNEEDEAKRKRLVKELERDIKLKRNIEKLL